MTLTRLIIGLLLLVAVLIVWFVTFRSKNPQATAEDNITVSLPIFASYESTESPKSYLEIIKSTLGPDPVLTITATHNILLGDCVVEGDYQFVIAAHETYQTTMTPEEFQTINAVIERAVTK